MINVNFGGFSLSDDYFSVLGLDLYDMASKKLSIQDIARNDGGVIVFDRFEIREIVLQGTLRANDENVDGRNAETQLDILKGVINQQEVLEVDYGRNVVSPYEDTVRRWTCVAKNMIVKRKHYNINHIDFSIQFVCVDPFGYSGDNDIYVDNSSITSGQHSYDIEAKGSGGIEPIFTITYSALNPTVSPVNIVVGNGANGEYLTINKQLTATSVVVIDCQRKQVFVDGNLTYASGQYPTIPRTTFVTDIGFGRHVLEYSDDAVSRTATITITGERRFI